jgi:hypothetical protein
LRLASAFNEPERIFEHVTLEELARFKESCDRLAVLMIQVIANAHQAPRARRWEGAPERPLPRNESPLADHGYNRARARVARVRRVARIGVDDDDVNDVPGVRRA